MISLRTHAKTLLLCVSLAALGAGCTSQLLRHTLENEGYDFLDEDDWVFTRYDIIADETTMGFMSREDALGLRVLVVTTWPGRTPPDSGLVHVVFVGGDERLAQGNRFFAVDRGDCLKAQFVADDQRLGPWPALMRESGRFRTRDADRMPSGRRILGYGPASLFKEYFAFEVGTEDLRAIAASEIVLGRICSIEFAWEPQTLRGLARYTALFAPATSESVSAPAADSAD